MAPDLSGASCLKPPPGPGKADLPIGAWHPQLQGEQAEKLSVFQVGQTFNEHLKGLLVAFQVVQQQNYELQQESAQLHKIRDLLSPRRREEFESKLDAKGMSLTPSKVAEVSISQIMQPVAAEMVQPKAVQTPQESHAQASGAESSSQAASSAAAAFAASPTESQLLAVPSHYSRASSNAFVRDAETEYQQRVDQFARLQDPRTHMLYSDDLASLVEHHLPGVELESLLNVMDYLSGKAKADAGVVQEGMGRPSGAEAERNTAGRDSEVSTPTRSSSTRSKVSMSMMMTKSMKAKEEAALHNYGIPFDSYVQLKTDQQLKGATHAIMRDIKRLREALRAEELHHLYQDDGHIHDEQDGHHKGPSERVAKFLELVPAVVIIINALVFGLQEEIATTSIFWDVVEVMFMCFYAFEAALKMYLSGCWLYFFGAEKMWNWLDFICLTTSVLDFGITQVILIMGTAEAPNLGTFMLLKLLRLARLARLIRALRYPIFRELNLMVMGVVSGVRVLLWAFFLLMVLIYVFGLIMVKLVGEAEEEFSNIWAAMFSLFRCFTDGCAAYDGTPLQERLRKKHGFTFLFGYLVTYILVSVGVFNLIMAIFIDNVVNSQAERKQQDLSDSSIRTEVQLKASLCKLILQSRTNGVPVEVEEEIMSLEEALSNRGARVRAQFDCLCSADIHITRNAFLVWLTDPNFLDALEAADIEIHNKVGLFDIMDADMGGSLTADEVFVGLMKLRGPVTKGDIVGMSLRVRHIALLMQEVTAKIKYVTQAGQSCL